MIKIWEGKFDAVLLGSFLYALLFALHEYLYEIIHKALYVNSDYITVNELVTTLSLIVMPMPAIIAGFITAYLITQKGLYYGLIVGFICSILNIAIAAFMSGYFDIDNYWYIISHSVTEILIPAVLAGGVGELFARNKNDQL